MIDNLLKDIYIIPGFLSAISFIYWSIIVYSAVICFKLINREIDRFDYNKRKKNIFKYSLFFISLFSAFIGIRLVNIFYFPRHLWAFSRALDSMVIPVHTYHAGLTAGVLLVIIVLIL